MPEPRNPRAAVSAEIRALMGRYRVTQTQLAQVLGMSQSSLSARLSGSVPWDVDDLDKIAEHFKVEVIALFGSEFPLRRKWATLSDSGLSIVPDHDLTLFDDPFVELPRTALTLVPR